MSMEEIGWALFGCAVFSAFVALVLSFLYLLAVTFGV